MIHVPKLNLRGSEATLRSAVKACRLPEQTWPVDILHRRLCVSQRTSRTVVLLADPAEVSRVLVESEKQFPKWMPIYRHSAARETGTGTIFASTDADWAPLRRAIKPLFHSSRWSLLVDVARHATLDATTTCNPVNIEAFFTAISVDVIMRTLVGDDADATADYHLAAIAQGLVEKQHAGDLHGAMQHIHELATTCTSRGPGAAAISGVDMAGALPPRPRPMQEPFLADNRLALLYAGQETTALTMSWCFWILGQDEELQSRLRSETRDAQAATGSLSPEAIGKMPRLMAVLRETLRLLSPSSATVRCTTQDETLCGQAIPANSVIVVPIYAIHRHRDLWDQPDTFDAERFLRPIKHPMAYLPFAAGRHTCSAARSVMYEMAAVLATMLDRFEWVTHAPEDMGLTNKLVLSPTSEMKVTLNALEPRGAAVIA
ncbi:cytochrome P450 [Pararhodobacter zhoushanensis]|uniref:Cytochrome P450 n=1 Tax=Pararhodobacter zhoushanensis TaxID=2479545 RepID=A0ABT3H5A2_9RHOB|nr:cytochrome P450 [Pararhodobacter zhoushanensis]MCW1934969.1 cytochrome P450 [Pararhodobacter zhoushanensis]